MILTKLVRQFSLSSFFTNQSRRLTSSGNFTEDTNLLKHLTSSFVDDSTENDQRINPENCNIFMFPGQGSQVVGMADSLLQYPNVSEMFQAASEILRFDLLKLCQDGPKVELDKTINSQPAILLTSLAAVEKLQAEEPMTLENCVAAVGYSVGEFAALVFSGALLFEDAVRLIGVRSHSMQKSSDAVDSSMITAIGSAKTRFKYACFEAREYCKEHLCIEDPVCQISAFISPNTVTIGGHTEAINYIKTQAENNQIRRIFDIPVSGAFHTKLMASASKDLKAALQNIRIQKPIIDVYSNVTGKKYSSASQIKQELSRQVVKPILWEATLSAMLSRDKSIPMPKIYEMGPGSQLGSLLKKCNGKAYQQYDCVNPVKRQSFI